MAGIEELREALGIVELQRELVEIGTAIRQLQPIARPAWYNLRAACELKGATYNTIKSRPELQPNGGKAEGEIGGRRVWSRASVEKWARMLDGSPARRKGA